MQVITYDRESEHIYGERLDLGFNAQFQPRPPVLGSIATKERPPHTATDHVESPRSVILNDKAAASGHGIWVIMDPYRLRVKISVLSVGGLGLRCCHVWGTKCVS